MLLHTDWSFRELDANKWYPAAVPGCVHTDLLDNGLIDDPFYRDNEEKLQWIENADWEYKTIFSISKEQLDFQQIELVFEGLDTYAAVYLNDVNILNADNMFRTWRIDIKSHLHPGVNDLLIRFNSPVKQVRPDMEKLPYTLPAILDHKKTRPWTRKAAYHYGWDWGPRFVTSGIWKPVYLQFHNIATIDSVQIIQNEINPGQAKLDVNVNLRSWDAKAITLRISEAGNAFSSVSTNIETTGKEQTCTVPLVIDDPELWWPNGLGEPNLYHINVELVYQDQVLDFEQEQIGLRTIELRQIADDQGTSFAFVVNGLPVFAKGGNWIPGDSFLNRVDEDIYSHFIQSCVDANMNMLRVWGGGIFEDDVFYDLCDEAGIMVWQDFMFSCGLYPADENFIENTRQEAIDNITRLRNHPCLVLWCGNNEMEWGFEIWNWGKTLPESTWQDYEKIFHDLLPQVCAEYDPTRPYWASSPSSGTKLPPGDMEHGDTHYWDVWHGKKPFTAFEELKPRFMSEYGFQSFPDMKTINSYTLPEDRNIDSVVMKMHQKHIGEGEGNQLLLEYMRRDYPEPKDFASLVYLSQVLQAEGIKTGSEHFRRLMPHCMGALYWQINDCWPVVSWASMDYYGGKKALHHFAKKFFSPVLVSLQEKGDQLYVHIVSDRTESFTAQIETRLYNLSGSVLATESAATEIAPTSSTVVQTIDLGTWCYGHSQDTIFIKSDVILEGEILSSNRHYLVPARELALQKPNITTSLQRTQDTFIITLHTDTLAKNVCLWVTDDNGDFSDNYFDLQPDEPVSVEYQPESMLLLWELRERLNIKTLTDMY